MVRINHGAFSLRLIYGRDEKLFRDLDLRRSKGRPAGYPFPQTENVASLDGDDLSRRNRLFREQTFAVNRTVAHFRLWRTIGQVFHIESVNGCE